MKYLPFDGFYMGMFLGGIWVSIRRQNEIIPAVQEKDSKQQAATQVTN